MPRHTAGPNRPATMWGHSTQKCRHWRPVIVACVTVIGTKQLHDRTMVQPANTKMMAYEFKRPQSAHSTTQPTPTTRKGHHTCTQALESAVSRTH